MALKERRVGRWRIRKALHRPTSKYRSITGEWGGKDMSRASIVPMGKGMGTAVGIILIDVDVRDGSRKMAEEGGFWLWDGRAKWLYRLVLLESGNAVWCNVGSFSYVWGCPVLIKRYINNAFIGWLIGFRVQRRRRRLYKSSWRLRCH